MQRYVVRQNSEFLAYRARKQLIASSWNNAKFAIQVKQAPKMANEAQQLKDNVGNDRMEVEDASLNAALLQQAHYREVEPINVEHELADMMETTLQMKVQTVNFSKTSRKARREQMTRNDVETRLNWRRLVTYCVILAALTLIGFIADPLVTCLLGAAGFIYVQFVHI